MIGNSVSGFELCSPMHVSAVDDTKMFVKCSFNSPTRPPFLFLTHYVCDAVYKRGIYIKASD